MILLTTDDFDEFQSVAKSIKTEPLLQTYIDRHEASFIKKILGVELGQKFIDDLPEESESGDMEDRFTDILQPFTEQNHCRIFESKGMKDVLASLIFYEYISGTQVKSTQAGVSKNQAEVSTVGTAEDAFALAESKWNDALNSIEAIKWFCRSFKPTIYPEYKGLHFRPKNSTVL